MFYRSLADRMRPTAQRQRAEAREARNEFLQTLQVSDCYLFALIIGGSVFARWLDMKTVRQVYIALAVYVLFFGVYCGLRYWENKKNPPLKKMLEKVD
ncbi:unnamed protein product [Amoebophrya sp. A25]|nr:unnamed protein product [Amoebophrya sp. A25]|eukprot:GSA25T00012509001.1